MPKTVPAGVAEVPGVGLIHLNAAPDPFDGRDLEYRPRLEPLPPALDQRDGPGERHVLRQQGNSCTGHAVAAVINTVLARSGQARPPRVSPYMLYRLARRYDEFPGEEDAGSSLRGAFKGWFHHGVAPESRWPELRMRCEPELEEEGFARECRGCPLGAFYRVNPYRLDDMQSAISELNAIAVSGAVHQGWLEPRVLHQGGRTLHVIARPTDARALGGHAFALVGYNEVGFLVQNSWGSGWGGGGFATLPYDDWLRSAYDAWVARPGVPSTPFTAGLTHGALGTARRLVTAPGPNLQRLAAHVVNLGNGGRLSTSGHFVSSPAQVDAIFRQMQQRHDLWRREGTAARRHVLLYAHGGLVSEADGLKIAHKHLNWWLNNRVYPVSLAWQSGPAETLVDHLVDTARGRLPAGGLGFDLVEQFDRLVEGLSRKTLRWMWDEMKENARAASIPIEDPRRLQWPPADSDARDGMAIMPGASLVVDRLRRYVERHGAEEVAVHLVGHSAGAVFHAALLERLREAGLTVESVALLAPALRVDEFREQVLPHLGKTVRHFAVFALSDERELDDVCGAGGVSVYHKSLLYLVARALERGDSGEVPLLGLARHADAAFGPDGQTLREEIEARGGAYITARSDAPDDACSDATAHGGFDDDAPTMTSVLLRVVGKREASDVFGYQADTALLDQETAEVRLADRALRGARNLHQVAPPMPTASGVKPPGETPLQQTARAWPPSGGSGVASFPGEDASPSGIAVLDVLEQAGWALQPPGGEQEHFGQPRLRSEGWPAR
ncbi:hypothetical protein [Deinococcus planocerae]|uniref:hypothetical protein n=1 Tax=Deinococcus planocerae TaxID=1737569 RepID=UPI000C7EFDCF|nr:hypothetical protein [Deinococcus planocerae]